MGLLDGDLQQVFGAAFGSVYLSGQLHRKSPVDDGEGGWLPGLDIPQSIKGQKEACSESMVKEAGYTSEDVMLIILQAGVGDSPTTDDEITLAGTRWSIASIRSDPANTHWIIRGQKYNGA